MLVSAFAVLLVLYLAWVIGANSVSLAVPMVTHLLTFRRSAVLVSLACFAGVFFFGSPVMDIVGNGVVVEISVAGALAVGLASALWMTLSTWKGMPISSTHTIVGAVVGYGLVLGSRIDYPILTRIAMSWLVSPLLGVVGGLITYFAIRMLLIGKAKGLRHREMIERVFTYLYILAGCMLAFSLGSNALAAAIGAVQGAYGNIHLASVELLATLAIGIGILTWGWRVVDIVDNGITDLTPSRGFCSLFTTALILLFFSAFGVPISATHTVVGSVIGVGLARGINQVDFRIFQRILFSWFVTVPAAALFSVIILKVVA